MVEESPEIPASRPPEPLLERATAINEQLLVSALRQHELTEEAEKLNERLQAEIVERKAVERILAEQARLLDLSTDAIIVRDVNNRITYWNHGAEELYGWKKEEAIGQDLHKFLRTEFEVPLEQLLAQLRREKRLLGEVIQTARDGRRIALLCRWSLDEDAEGNPGAILTTTTDVTDLKKAEDALREAMTELARTSRAKDDFLAALSHELRTPLTPVLMTSAALEGDPSLPLEVREQLGMIRRNIELETRLIDDLLDLTRISRGKMRIAPVTTDLHLLMQHTADIVRSDGLGKQVQIEYKLEAERFHAHADPTRLQQVFWNLLKNALKFTPAGGTITVSTRNDEEGKVHVTVTDTGIGIGEQALPHIFKAFEQGDVAGQHRYGGLGLGLAISRAIMEVHGGAIRAESGGVGRGSTFTVSLANVDPPAALANVTIASLATVRSLRLLVVEDHEPSRVVLTRLLTRYGHQVTGAGTVAEALAAFARGRFDGVISDLGLPDGNGLDMMREMQLQRPVPAIALSGYGMEEDMRKSTEAGFFAHLVKPIHLTRLRLLLDQIEPGAESAVVGLVDEPLPLQHIVSA